MMLWIASAMILTALGGCVDTQEEEATEPQSAQTAPDPESAADLTPDAPGAPQPSIGGGLCCIDYSCPGTDIEFTGCKSGSSSIGAAYRACDAACSVSCKSSGLYCD
jgi:hypothetical protein